MAFVNRTPLETVSVMSHQLFYRRMIDLVNDTWSLMGKLPADVSSVVGIARSGILPASLISTWLHLPLWSISLDGALVELGCGVRGYSLREGPMLVVDDSVCSGNTMPRIKDFMQDRDCLYAAVYPLPESVSLVDYYGVLCPWPHLFEWNLFNSAIIDHDVPHDPLTHHGIATDMDGVLCEDCPEEMDGDDTPKGDETYRQWMQHVSPLRVPRLAVVPHIVTLRLERFRPETEAWLARWGIRWKRLDMHPAETFSERNRCDPGRWKAEVLVSSPCAMFLESDSAQAAPIHRLWGKPVIVPSTGEVFQ